MLPGRGYFLVLLGLFLLDMQLYIPDEKTLEKFENIVSPMYSAMQENTKESKILANTRDALLPKLMPGELDVSDIDL